MNGPEAIVKEVPRYIEIEAKRKCATEQEQEEHRRTLADIEAGHNKMPQQSKARFEGGARKTGEQGTKLLFQSCKRILANCAKG